MIKRQIRGEAVRRAIVILTVALAWTATAMADSAVVLERIGTEKGVCVVLGLPTGGTEAVIDLAKTSELVLFFQSPDPGKVNSVREAAQSEGLLGSRIFAAVGPWSAVPLADNMASAALVNDAAKPHVEDAELLRVLHPEGKAIIGGRKIAKPHPAGVDSWSHLYHGADNNPLSADKLARWPYLTQFLGNPKFVPMPEVSVAAGGRVFRAYGHIAHLANQNKWLNTLVCSNGYNGLILWKRPLNEGFMIHRSTMIATPDILYLGDDASCKRLDARTGKLLDEIVVPEGLADGPVWKWMALEGDVLYALVGGKEFSPPTQRAGVERLGHWPWGMWPGHDYKDPKTNFGYGRTLLSIDVKTKKVIWSHREEEYLDSRGLCANDRHIFCYAPEKFLMAVDLKSGDVAWKTSDAKLLEAIGPNGRAQIWFTGYSTQSYVKCDAERIFFAGPQRVRLVVASSEDGKLLWQKERGNFQIVLRDDGLYAAGPLRMADDRDRTVKLGYDGRVLATLPQRRACTRATGTLDSIFFRASGGTVRIDTATNTAQHIAPMRPPCQDGVIISDGHLYWGPWMCGCQLSLYGHIGLAPAGGFDYRPGLDAVRFEPGDGDPTSVQGLQVRPGDWPAYGGDNARSGATKTAVAENVQLKWAVKAARGAMPTAPIAAGGWVFLADRAGTVRAYDGEGHEKWRAYTGASVYFPPALWEGRLFVGSADGRVYALEAATGRKLWNYRVGPAERRICVYGNLISTWPVAGGVVVEKGVMYAAAGIAHYDGTHVIALDAVSGKPKWYNDTSGVLSKTTHSGVSLQGGLRIEDGELRFTGGGVCETARFDLATGKCLNGPHDHVHSGYHTAFYPYYPEYGKYLSLDHTLADGTTLVYDITYEGSRYGKLALLSALKPGQSRPKKPVSRWGAAPRRGPKTDAKWTDKGDGRFASFIVGPELLVAAGELNVDGKMKPFLTAFRLKNGQRVWTKELPAMPVKGGTAIDHGGQVYVSTEDGRLMCFAPSK